LRVRVDAATGASLEGGIEEGGACGGFVCLLQEECWSVTASILTSFDWIGVD
jgi:hypothetical protein